MDEPGDEGVQEMVSAMNEPVFSIIVPVYKVEAWIGRCLDSLVNQTEQNIEMILVDDGSPDRCPQICDEYAAKDARIVVIHKKNGGLSDARNAGLDKARGSYVMFVDADDYIDRDSCERLLPFAAYGADIIAVDGAAEGRKAGFAHHGPEAGVVCSGVGFMKKSIVPGSLPMAAWLYIYRRAFLRESGLYFKKGILHEDEQFTPRAVLAADSVVYAGFAPYHYTVREDSITKEKDKRKHAEDLYETCLELRGLYDGLDDDVLKLYLKDSLVCKYLSLFQEGRLYQYGKAYIHKAFVLRTAYRRKTKWKAVLFCVSPRLYWHINNRINC